MDWLTPLSDLLPAQEIRPWRTGNLGTLYKAVGTPDSPSHPVAFAS